MHDRVVGMAVSLSLPDVNSEHIPHASDTGHLLAGRSPFVPCGQSLVEHIPHASDTGYLLAGRSPFVPCGQSLVDSRFRRG